MVRKKAVPERNGDGHCHHGRRCLGCGDDQPISSPVCMSHGGALMKKRGQLHNQHITQSARALRQMTLELLPSPSVVPAPVGLIGENLEVLDTPENVMVPSSAYNFLEDFSMPEDAMIRAVGSSDNTPVPVTQASGPDPPPTNPQFVITHRVEIFVREIRAYVSRGEGISAAELMGLFRQLDGLDAHPL